MRTILLLSISLQFASSYLSSYRVSNAARLFTASSSSHRYRCLHPSASDNDGSRRPQETERLLEGLSRDGAANIADMSLTERTKRAMLAEKIEDEIFSRAAELDRLSNEAGTIPEQHMPLAREIASQARILQMQYDELVSGQESSVLNALEKAMNETAAGNNGTSTEKGANDIGNVDFQ